METQAKPRKIDPARYWRFQRAAKKLGILPQTVRAAIDRGEITTVDLADGSQLVTLDQLRRWSADNTRRRGRPANSDRSSTPSR